MEEDEVVKLPVYQRMLKLRPQTSANLGERLAVVFVAGLNLDNENDIIEFFEEHKRVVPMHYRQDVQYALSFLSIETRKLWQKALGDRIHIDILYNRSERDAYKWIEFVKSNGDTLSEYNDYTNENKGMHMNAYKI